MNLIQGVILLFALLAITIDIWAIVHIVRTPDVHHRPLWIIGSLIGFIGFSIDWTQADDIYLTMGVTIPVVWLSVVGGHFIVKTGFPIVGAVALVEVGRRTPK